MNRRALGRRQVNAVCCSTLPVIGFRPHAKIRRHSDRRIEDLLPPGIRGRFRLLRRRGISDSINAPRSCLALIEPMRLLRPRRPTVSISRLARRGSTGTPNRINWPTWIRFRIRDTVGRGQPWQRLERPPRLWESSPAVTLRPCRFPTGYPAFHGVRLPGLGFLGRCSGSDSIQERIEGTTKHRAPAIPRTCRTKGSTPSSPVGRQEKPGRSLRA